MVLTALVDKQDTREIIRNRIGAILVAERDNQMALATAASRDPSEWDFYVYVDRMFPWSLWENDNDTKPAVNVWFESESVMGQASDPFGRQTQNGQFVIDVVARGLNRSDGGTGQVLGDKDAIANLHRAIRFVRNFLMSGENKYLGLQKVADVNLVSQRMVDSVTFYQPQLDDQTQNATFGARINLAVRYNEYSPENAAEGVLCEIRNQITLSPSNEVIGVDYDHS